MLALLAHHLVFTAIYENGKLLVDTVNDSEVWSEAPYFNDNGFAFEYGNNSKMLFNGKLATSYDDGTVVPKTGGTFNLDFGTEFNDASKVKFWVWFGPNVAAENSFLINGSPVTSMTTFDALHFFEVDLPSGLQTIQWSGPNVPTNNTQTILSAIYVDGKMLVDTAARNLGDSRVEYQTGGGQGSIIEVNTTDNTLLVTNSGNGDNRWIAENKAGTDFYVAPASAVPISQDYAWGKLQIVNNKAQVTGIQKDDPGFLPVPAKDYSIKFPAVFPTGNEPDSDIPRGACVAAIVAAENSEGRSVKESNCFMPADVNPEGAAGPITDSTPTQLTVASNANLGDFSPGDNLVMVTEDNVISNYTMQTSTIESVDVRQGFEYKYYGIPGENGPTLAQKLSQIPSISTATYFEDVNFGERPSGYGNVHYSFYELSEPGIVSVTRLGGNANKDASLAWSDDGTNWRWRNLSFSLAVLVQQTYYRN